MQQKSSYYRTTPEYKLTQDVRFSTIGHALQTGTGFVKIDSGLSEIFYLQVAEKLSREAVSQWRRRECTICKSGRIATTSDWICLLLLMLLLFSVTKKVHKSLVSKRSTVIEVYHLPVMRDNEGMFRYHHLLTEGHLHSWTLF